MLIQGADLSRLREKPLRCIITSVRRAGTMCAVDVNSSDYIDYKRHQNLFSVTPALQSSADESSSSSLQDESSSSCSVINPSPIIQVSTVAINFWIIDRNEDESSPLGSIPLTRMWFTTNCNSWRRSLIIWGDIELRRLFNSSISVDRDLSIGVVVSSAHKQKVKWSALKPASGRNWMEVMHSMNSISSS